MPPPRYLPTPESPAHTHTRQHAGDLRTHGCCRGTVRSDQAESKSGEWEEMEEGEGVEEEEEGEEGRGRQERGGESKRGGGESSET